MFRKSIYCLFAIAFLGERQAPAATLTFTDPVAFFAALPGAASTLDFDGSLVRTSIPSGNALAGITFSYSIAGLAMAVVDDFDTTSPANYLGLNNPGNFDQFIAGDSFDMLFATPAAALGLYVITTADPVFAGDIQLVTPIGTALNAGTPNLTLPDGGTAFFIGLVSDTAFSNASVQFDPGAVGAFLYNVDDITTSAAAVARAPEPSAALLCLGALALLVAARACAIFSR